MLTNQPSSRFTTIAGTFGSFTAMVALALSLAPAAMHIM